MAATVTQLRVAVGADTSKAEAGLDRVSGKIGLVSSTALKASATGIAVLSAGLLALGAVGIKSAIDFESAFAGVRKTIDGTEEEFASLKSEIRDMAKSVPATREEISRVAEAAGQLGIQKSAILGFTRTMIDLGEATNLTSDEAAESLAKLANITRMPQENFDRLGATVVALGNAGASTESDIVAMGLRLAGAGAQVGMANAQILGFASALSSVGIEAEAGGTAFSRVMIDMSSAIATQSPKVAEFAKVAGMSAAQFSKAFKDDAASAMISFVEGLDRISSAGGNVFGVLDKLDLSDIRVRDSLLRASGAGDLFREAIKTGTTAWAENTALTKEAEQRYATTASQLAIMRNRMSDIALTIGEALLPSLNETLRNLSPFITAVGQAAPGALTALGSAAGAAGGAVRDKTASALQFVQDKLAESGRAWAPWAATAGPAGELVSSTLSGVSGIVESLSFLLQGNLPAAADSARGAFGNLSSAASILQDPIGVLQGLWGSIQKAMDGFAPTGERIGAALGNIGAAVGRFVPEPLGGAVKGMLGMADAAKDGDGAIKRFADMVNTASGHIAGITKQISDNKQEFTPLVAVVAAGATAWLLLSAGALAASASLAISTAATVAATAATGAFTAVFLANPIGIFIVALAGLAAGLVYAYNTSDEFRAHVDAAFTVVQQVVSLTGEAFSRLGTVVNDLANFGSMVWNNLKTIESDAKKAALGIGIGIVQGIIDGINGLWDGAVATFQGLVQQLPDGVKKLLGIASPSKVFEEIGEDIVAGLVSGIDNRLDSVKDASTRLVSASRLAIAQGIAEIRGESQGVGPVLAGVLGEIGPAGTAAFLETLTGVRSLREPAAAVGRSMQVWQQASRNTATAESNLAHIQDEMQHADLLHQQKILPMHGIFLDYKRQLAALDVEALPARARMADIERRITDASRSNLSLARDLAVVNQASLNDRQQLARLELEKSGIGLARRADDLDLEEEALDLKRRMINASDEEAERLQKSLDRVSNQQEALRIQDELERIGIERKGLSAEQAVHAADVEILALRQKEEQEKAGQAVVLAGLAIEKEAQAEILAGFDQRAEALEAELARKQRDIDVEQEQFDIQRLQFQSRMVDAELWLATKEAERVKAEQTYQEGLAAFVNTAKASALLTADEAIQTAERLGLWDQNAAGVQKIADEIRAIPTDWFTTVHVAVVEDGEGGGVTLGAGAVAPGLGTSGGIDYDRWAGAVAEAIRRAPPVVALDSFISGLQADGIRNGGLLSGLRQ